MPRAVVPVAVGVAVCGLVAGAIYLRPAPAELAAPVTSESLPTTVAVTTSVPITTVPSSTAATTTVPPAPSTPTATPRPAPAVAPPPAAAPPQLPLPYSGPAGQVITVVAASSASTTAQLSAWTRSGAGWTRDIGPVTAYVGSAGIGTASETTRRTPAGVFGLTEAFGILADNGTRLPYRRVDTSDWWVSDVHSPDYNTHQRCAPGTCPFDEAAGENLGSVGLEYHHAVVIDYNRYPVTPGAGSAYFLHVSAGRPTAGCVTLPSTTLTAVMRWLDPAKNPVIRIGVG